MAKIALGAGADHRFPCTHHGPSVASSTSKPGSAGARRDEKHRISGSRRRSVAVRVDQNHVPETAFAASAAAASGATRAPRPRTLSRGRAVPAAPAMRSGHQAHTSAYPGQRLHPRRQLSLPSHRHLRSQLRQHDALLVLVLALAICVAHFTHFVGLEEQDLAQTFVCIDARGQSGVVFEISSVTKPSHSGSNGVTFTIMPHRA